MPLRPKIHHFVEWDVPTWSDAIYFWDHFLQSRFHSKNALALEVGAHRGGLSLYFAACYGIHIICSDLHNPRNEAEPLHRPFCLESLISYESVDVFNTEYPDAHFDYVLFKSVLGEVAPRSKPQNKARMMKEIHRILKPGGAVLFAENMVGTRLHTWARNRFRKWGNDWGYSTVDEIKQLMNQFSPVIFETTGFLSAFVPYPGLKKILHIADLVIKRFIPEECRYVIYGVAVKPTDIVRLDPVTTP